MITGIIIAVLLVIIMVQHAIIEYGRIKRHLMGHDKLTGICNLEHLMQKVEELPDKKKKRLVIYSDIAEFKLINEMFGIEKGNEILIEQSKMIKKYAADGCLYGRVGEDHFVVIVDEDAFEEQYLYKCRNALQKVMSDSVYTVRICFGIYKTNDMSESLSSMCDKASLAIAAIKDDAQRFIAYYDDTMLEDAIMYKTIVDEFDEAMTSGEFKMYLQPQISAKTRQLTIIRINGRHNAAITEAIPVQTFLLVPTAMAALAIIAAVAGSMGSPPFPHKQVLFLPVPYNGIHSPADG